MTKRLATTFLLTTCLLATPVLAETTPASVIGAWTGVAIRQVVRRKVVASLLVMISSFV